MAPAQTATETEQPTRIIWAPQKGPQKALVDCPLAEIFYGGARGGGKTDGILGKWALKQNYYGRHFNAIFYRKAMPASDDVVERSKEIYSALGAAYHEQKAMWRFPNGARVRFRHLENVKDAESYQGQNVTDACVEEAGLYPRPDAIDRLNGILRSAHGIPTQLILTANPGGPGQLWIKHRYIDPAPGGMVVHRRTLPNGEVHKYVYIPSRVTDNKFLVNSDYVKRLYLVGNQALVKAWLEGDWNAIEGAFFDNWSSARHVCKPFPIPPHWVRFRSGDWGSAAPFSFGWHAVASDDYKIDDRRTLPRGGLVRYREWYGASAPNVGLKLTAEAVGLGILEREAHDPKIDYGVLDPSAFAQDGGPSIAERIHQVTKGKVTFRPADNKRVGTLGHIGGWDLVRHRFDGEAEDRPMIVIFDTCKDIIRTLPVLQHDDVRVEDLDTNSEDHAADDLRYGCASRPWLRKTPQGPLPITGIETVTMDRLWLEQKRSVNRRV
jgi:hypothetical protein